MKKVNKRSKKDSATKTKLQAVGAETFGDKTKRFLKRNYIYIIMGLLVVARIGLGYAMGGWYGISETYDDVAMMQGLSLKRLIEPTNLALIKDLSFSLFLGFGAISGLPYTVVLSGFWALTALVAWLLTGKVTKNKWVRLFVFSYVLFLPIAFTSWGGLRIYRNAIIAPCIILTFCLALMLVIDLVRQEKMKRTIWTAIFAGISFAFTYFLKEDGLWLKACMLVILLVSLGIIGYRLFKKKVKGKFEIKKAFSWTLVCLIPFVVLFVWDNVYRGVNYAFFGVYEINTRTEGELGKFVENIYKIDSPNRSEIVWAPYDAIEKAFEVSPTLAAQPKLLDEILNTGWNEGGIKENPIKYDFLGWVMRSELVDAGLWTSEKDVSDMFKQVNNELEQAFKDGTLKKAEGRIQLLASTGGYTLEEMLGSDLADQVFMSLGDSIWMTNYDVGFSDEDVYYGTKGVDHDYTKINKVLHMNNDVNVASGTKREVSKGVGKMMFWVYRIANVTIMLLVVGYSVYIMIKIVKTKGKYVGKNKLTLACFLVGYAFFGIAIVYSFATAWFFISPRGSIGYLPHVFVFYRVGVFGLTTMSLISVSVGVFRLICGKGKINQESVV